MSFTWEWALAIFVFLFANLFLGVQLLKLFWPLRMLKLTAKMRKEAVDPQSWLGLVADENAVRAALPIREAIFLLQKGTLSKDEVKYRKLWLRSWVYTIATLVLVYVQPQLASGSEAAMSLTLLLCQSLAAYAQGLLIKALADFRRTRIQKVLDAGARSPEKTDHGEQSESGVLNHDSKPTDADATKAESAGEPDQADREGRAEDSRRS